MAIIKNGVYYVQPIYDSHDILDTILVAHNNIIAIIAH